MHGVPLTSHCFAINGNAFNPELDGLDEVVDCYKKVVTKIRFDGPTYFE
jgi:hypothetical protein